MNSPGQSGHRFHYGSLWLGSILNLDLETNPKKITVNILILNRYVHCSSLMIVFTNQITFIF